MIDFSVPQELETARYAVEAFMDEYVYQNEAQMVEDEGLPVELERDLQRKVKAQGLGSPTYLGNGAGLVFGLSVKPY